MEQNETRECPVCCSKTLERVIDISAVPVYCNVLWATEREAVEATTGNISLVFCSDCGHFFNSSFDASLVDYAPNYENSLHFSPFFSEYAKELADRLEKTYELRGKDIIEIGCGKGEFLKLLCRNGQNRGIGFDRSYDRNRNGARDEDNIRFVQDFYGASYSKHPVDFLCCRHVLEHIEHPVAFLRGIGECLDAHPGAVLYFEVPDALFTIRSLGIWDLIYEHCSYFTRRSLTRAFELAGFEILALDESFGGQFLCVEAKLSPVSTQARFQDSLDIGKLIQDVGEFAEMYREKVEGWRARLRSAPRRTVVWGGGSKGVTFLNAVQETAEIEFVVDLNPHKHGKYVPGTGQKVIAPQTLADYRPERVIAMNPLYADEISESLLLSGIRADLTCA